LVVHGLFATCPLQCISIRQAAPRMPRPVDPLREMAEGGAGGPLDAHRTGPLSRSEEASRSSISRSPCDMERQVVGSCRTLSVRSPIESTGRKASMRPHSNRGTSDARAGRLLSRRAQGVDPLLPLQQRARRHGSTLVLERDTWGTKCLTFAVNLLNTPRRKRAHTGQSLADHRSCRNTPDIRSLSPPLAFPTATFLSPHRFSHLAFAAWYKRRGHMGQGGVSLVGLWGRRLVA